MVKFGAVLLTGALMTGCGTVEEDNDIDLREDEPPMENNQNEDNRDNGDQNNDQLDEEKNDEKTNEQQSGERNEQRDGQMNDREMETDEN